MLAYVVRRLLLVVVVVWGAATLAFVLLQLSGDPLNLLLPLDATRRSARAIARRWASTGPCTCSTACTS
jgi:peptide/nickel transport system permease protein